MESQIWICCWKCKEVEFLPSPLPFLDITLVPSFSVLSSRTSPSVCRLVPICLLPTEECKRGVYSLHSSVRPPVHKSLHPSVHLSACSPLHSPLSIHPSAFIHLTDQPCLHQHPCMYTAASSTHPSILSSSIYHLTIIHLFAPSLHSSTHSFIHPSITTVTNLRPHTPPAPLRSPSLLLSCPPVVLPIATLPPPTSSPVHVDD